MHRPKIIADLQEKHEQEKHKDAAENVSNQIRDSQDMQPSSEGTSNLHDLEEAVTEQEEEESPSMNLPVTIGLLISVTVVCVPPFFSLCVDVL